MTEESTLPPPSVPLHVLAHIMFVLERRDPGVLDDLLTSLENEAAQMSVIRLRRPREAPELAANRLVALEWVETVRRNCFAVLGSRKRRKA